MLSIPPAYNSANSPARQPSPIPRRTDSLSTGGVKSKVTSPLTRSREDVKFARIVLDPSIISKSDAEVSAETRDSPREERERELTEMLSRMTNWVDELATLLQQAYKNQTDLETALTLTRSNLQLALANNEMLEEALQRGGGKDVGWRRWSDREGILRTSSVRDYTQQDNPNNVTEVLPTQQRQWQQQQQSVPSRFFNFRSSLQRVSSPANTSPIPTQSASSHSGYTDGHMYTTSTRSVFPSASVPSSRSSTPIPSPNVSNPEPPRTVTPPPLTVREQALATQLSKERAALGALSQEKSKLENELEGLSQALFEEANKMVSTANRKLAETEEELRIVTEQREALRGALRIVEGENGRLRGRNLSSDPFPSPATAPKVDDTPPIAVSTNATLAISALPTVTSESFWSPDSPSTPSISYVISPSTDTPPSTAPTLISENSCR